MTQRETTVWVLISGSKKRTDSRREIDRFLQIAEAIGRALALPNVGLLGCAPHSERVLASEAARVGFRSVDPTAAVSTGTSSVDKFYHDDRINLARKANAAVFVGGSSGTLEEYDLCRSRHVSPLIPVAGAGGGGATLARRAVNAQDQFWKNPVDAQTLSILASADASPEQYAEAVVRVLTMSGVIPVVPPCETERATRTAQPSDEGEVTREATHADSAVAAKSALKKWWQFWK